MPKSSNPSDAHQLKTQRSLVLIKPDGVQRHLVGDILHRFERAGLKIVGLKMVWATPAIINQHYRQDEAYLRSIGEKTIEGMRKQGLPIQENPLAIGRRVRGYLVNHLSVSPVVALALEGTNAIKNVRQLVGATDPIIADVGTVRGDFTIDTIQMADLESRSVRNLIHASGDPEEAEREIRIWFTPEELYAYRTVMDVVLHDEDWDRRLPKGSRRPPVAPGGAEGGSSNRKPARRRT